MKKFVLARGGKNPLGYSERLWKPICVTFYIRNFVHSWRGLLLVYINCNSNLVWVLRMGILKSILKKIFRLFREKILNRIREFKFFYFSFHKIPIQLHVVSNIFKNAARTFSIMPSDLPYTALEYMMFFAFFAAWS